MAIEGTVGHLIDCGFGGRTKNALPWGGKKKGWKKPGSSRVGSGHDATVITVNYCSQVGNIVTLTFYNHDTIFTF